MLLIDDSDEHFPRREAYDEQRRKELRVRSTASSQVEPEDSLHFQIPIIPGNPFSHYEKWMK